MGLWCETPSDPRYLSAQSDQVHEGQYRQKGIDDFYGFKAYRGR